jgi:hypothetical protein
MTHPYILNPKTGHYRRHEPGDVPAADEVVVNDEPVPNEDYTRYVPRMLDDIAADLRALSQNQQIATWNDFMTKQRWKYQGHNADLLWLAQMLGNQTSLKASEQLEAQIRCVSYYVKDWPDYLVNPAFDPSINVSGKQPG